MFYMQDIHVPSHFQARVVDRSPSGVVVSLCTRLQALVGSKVLKSSWKEATVYFLPLYNAVAYTCLSGVHPSRRLHAPIMSHDSLIRQDLVVPYDVLQYKQLPPNKVSGQPKMI